MPDAPLPFNRPLADLGDADAALRGIRTPAYDADEVARYVSSRFGSAEGARAQAALPDLTGHYHKLLSTACRVAGIPTGPGNPISVLELGCGVGNATLPLARLFPDATIVATELSLAMLRELKERIGREPAAGSVRLLQLNAEDLDFADGSFHLVAGAALLHHLIRPGKVFEGAARILRPGGCMIFFEPFENGMAILRLVYEAILSDRRSLFLGKALKFHLRYYSDYWLKEATLEESDPFFLGQDDKRLFTRTALDRMALSHGFERCILFPLDDSATPFRDKVRTLFDGNGVGAVPGWVWGVVERFEKSFSPRLKAELFTEAGIVVRKPA